MEIETALKNYLAAQTSITSLNLPADRMHFVFVDNQATAKPYMVITKIDDPGTHTQNGPVAVGNPRVQISIFDTTLTKVQAIAAAVKAALDGYVGIIGGAGGIYVSPIFFEDENPGHLTDPSTYYIDQDYFCQTEG